MKVLEISGGVGGARMARGLTRVDDADLTVVVNVGDDETIHGLAVSPDLDTVVYTLAGVEGEQGWGRSGDTFTVNDELTRFGVDNTFRLGDLDLALNIFRTSELRAGRSLSEVTRQVTKAFEVLPTVVPATDDRLRTMLRVDDGWIGFQEYFVLRRSQETVHEIRFDGEDQARPAPGVIDAIQNADVVVIAPSNPPLSIWPVLAIGGIRPALEAHPRVVAVSPLISGKALKGPADRVMRSLGLPPGNFGVARAYEGIIDTLVIDTGDAGDTTELDVPEVIVADTLIREPSAAERLAKQILAR